MSKKQLKVLLPAYVASEISRVSGNTQRSTAFIVLRALLAAPKDAVAETGSTPLVLSLDDDDPASTLTKIAAAAGNRPLDQAVAGAWFHTKDRFSKWLAQESEARKAEESDELDAALAEAQSPNTSAAALGELAHSAYPRVRALVAAHPATNEATLAKLAQDREPYVRDAVENRKLKR